MSGKIVVATCMSRNLDQQSSDRGSKETTSKEEASKENDCEGGGLAGGNFKEESSKVSRNSRRCSLDFGIGLKIGPRGRNKGVDLI